MMNFKPGDKVRVISSLKNLNALNLFILPLSAHELFGKTVTILDQPIEGWPLYRIQEDGGHHLYPASFFSKHVAQTKKQFRHKWTDEELSEARRLICDLLVSPDKRHSPDASYRFIDLVTPYLTGELSDGKPRVMLIRVSLKGLDFHVYSGIASPYDEPNVLIGMAVCLCKAKGMDIPEWIMRPTESKEPCKCN